ncbi:hypothetical protein DAEQUDRAFT_811226 [Daedalea quercina L-15889]|uniref:Microbial-type PARG catalytic domain-containing protein n=1 Tax=Daedalea quercina L-15889 TaxID=1314783 RepID=A0A165QMW6_9APHY|nr:hypothetical protein DAEQUDRAFT_811226 [Daedalea quercina L-15889]
MRNRKSTSRKKAVYRRSVTPTSASDYADAKRQYLKRQRLQQRGGSSSTSHSLRPRVTPSKRHFWHENQKTKQAVAEETRAIVLGDGKYVEERRVSAVTTSPALSTREGHVPGVDAPEALQVPHDIAIPIQLCRQGTTFYPHYSEALARWATTRPHLPPVAETMIDFFPRGPLTTARRLSRTTLSLRMQRASSPNESSLGVLSFASPKRPCGGFLQGGDEQEDKIARHSSLLASLSSPAAQQFYQEHKKFLKEDGSGLHDHSMVYSPGVVVFRREGDDDLPPDPDVSVVSASPIVNESVGGEFIPPYLINVISAVPVNAMAVRAKHIILPSEQHFFENGIRSAMKERMARILHLFEEKGNRVLVLGAFGCGPQSQNNVEAIASIWAELLVCGDLEGRGGTKREARFKHSFEKIVFAVSGKMLEQFKKAFKARLFEADVADAAMDNS